MSLSASSVLITGASRGLGLQFVKQILKLPQAPRVLIAACRNPDTATELCDMAKVSPILKIIKLDTEKDEDIDAAVQEVQSLVGESGLNLLINNAGIHDKAVSGLRQMTRGCLQKHFDVNTSAPIIMTQKFLPLLELAAACRKTESMSCSKAGVVNISTIMGSQQLSYNEGLGATLHYKCSKSALNMASVMMARELKEAGILVVALHPGWVQTDMGTEKAPLSPEESIASCLKVIGSIGEESTGKFKEYSGKELPF